MEILGSSWGTDTDSRESLDLWRTAGHVEKAVGVWETIRKVIAASDHLDALNK